MRKSNSLRYSLNAKEERQPRQTTWGLLVGEAARLTRKYKSTGFRIKQLQVRLVFLPFLGQQLGQGSVSSRIRMLTFLKTTCHVAPFVFGTRPQGYIVRVLLVNLVQVLFRGVDGNVVGD